MDTWTHLYPASTPSGGEAAIRQTHQYVARMVSETGGWRVAISYGWLADRGRLPLDALPDGAVALLGAVAGVEGLIGLCGEGCAPRWGLCANLVLAGANNADARLPLGGSGPHSAVALMQRSEWVNALTSEARHGPIATLTRFLRDGPAMQPAAVTRALDWLVRCSEREDWGGLLIPLGPEKSGAWRGGGWEGVTCHGYGLRGRSTRANGPFVTPDGAAGAREALLQVIHDVLVAHVLQPAGDAAAAIETLLERLAPREAGRIVATLFHTFGLLIDGLDGAPRVAHGTGPDWLVASLAPATTTRILEDMADDHAWRTRGMLLSGNLTRGFTRDGLLVGVGGFITSVRNALPGWIDTEAVAAHGERLRVASATLEARFRDRIPRAVHGAAEWQRLAEAAETLGTLTGALGRMAGIEVVRAGPGQRRRC